MKNIRADQLATELARMLDIASLDQNMTIAAMGWDSMMLVELAIAAEVVYDRRINLEKLKLDFHMTLREVLTLVDTLMSETAEAKAAGQA